MSSTRRYAERTKVPLDQSQNEVRRLLKQLGADRIAMVDEPAGASVFFQIEPLTYILRSPAPPDGTRDVDRWQRENWRSIVLLIKAKKVAIEQGITTVEREFIADAVMPDGTQLIDHAPRMIQQTYDNGGPPQLTWQGGSS